MKEELTFAEYVESEFRRLSNNIIDPQNSSYEEVFDLMFDEYPRIKEAAFLFYGTQGKEKLLEFVDAFEDYHARKNIMNKLDVKDPTNIKLLLKRYNSTRSLLEFLKVAQRLNLLNDDQYNEVFENPTYELMYNNYGFSMRCAKYADVWNVVK